MDFSQYLSKENAKRIALKAGVFLGTDGKSKSEIIKHGLI